MATNKTKMLIDASHPEETRVVVLRGNRIEEFDFESQTKQQLKGNIYLAKVTRVEPSLQAAFVDYGGNRHGFLAFSEIHPDYYQIPVADRQALLAAQAAERQQSEFEEDAGELLEDEDAELIEVDTDAEAEESKPEESSKKRRRPRRSRRSKAAKIAESEETSEVPEPDSGEAPNDAREDCVGDDGTSAIADAKLNDHAEEETVEESASDSDDANQSETVDEPDTIDQNSDQSAQEIEVEVEDSGKTSIAAMIETDSISEPLDDDDDQTENDSDAEANSENSENEPNAEAQSDAAPAKPKRKPTRRRSRRTKSADTENPTAEKGEKSLSEDNGANADDGDVTIADTKTVDSDTEVTLETLPATDDKPIDADQTVEDSESVDQPADGEADSEILEADNAPEESADASSSDDTSEAEAAARPARTHYRRYKIQEVIKRRQVLLVQVVKEERGNKGAALTTYLSLAGRYSVLMPNTARGSGISRKITNSADRKRMKAIVSELDLPDGMGIILRTAGASRKPEEIKRDFEYLMRLWEKVRNLTLSSSAPSLVYEEGNLIKRSIRDLYTKDTAEVHVSGEKAFNEARDFMEMLMPGHGKKVRHYKRKQAILSRFGAEAQLERMFTPQVTLKSGGYLVINQTEALVAIDVNSGKSTREHSIEDTALQTNLEAAEEVACQLRLRDLAGLIVIDFIDMDEKRNNRAVEKRLKECLKNDRARIQISRISHFGLLEMSRQRMRASVLDSTMEVCPHCEGRGIIRSPASISLQILRAVEEQLHRNSRHDLLIRTPVEIAMHALNHKRQAMNDIEDRYGVKIIFEGSRDILGENFTIENNGPASGRVIIEENAINPSDDSFDGEIDADDGSEEPKRKRSRNRRQERGLDATKTTDEEYALVEDGTSAESDGDRGSSSQSSEESEAKPKKRRRGKRGGKRNQATQSAKNNDDAQADDSSATDGAPSSEASASDVNSSDSPANETSPNGDDVNAETPTLEETADAEQENSDKGKEASSASERSKRNTRRPRKSKTVEASSEEQVAKDKESQVQAPEQAEVSEPVADQGSEQETPQPRKRRTRRTSRSKTNEAVEAETVSDSDADSEQTSENLSSDRNEPSEQSVPISHGGGSGQNEDEVAALRSEAVENEPEKPQKKGWWSGKGFF